MNKKISEEIISNSNTLIVYYRQGCHLCEQMLVSLYQQQKIHQSGVAFEIKIIDIDNNPKLLQQYNVDVPVVMYQDEVIFYHFFDEKEFKYTLKKMKK